MHRLSGVGGVGSGGILSWASLITKAGKMVGGYPNPLQHLKPLLSEDWLNPLISELRLKFMRSQKIHPLWSTVQSMITGQKHFVHNRGLAMLLATRALSSSTLTLNSNQRRLADMCETIYLGMAIHRTIVDIQPFLSLEPPFHHQSAVRLKVDANGKSFGIVEEELSTSSSSLSMDDNESSTTTNGGGGGNEITRGILDDLQLGNKLATLVGGMFLSTVSTGLGEFSNCQVVELVSNAMSCSIQSQFIDFLRICDTSFLSQSVYHRLPSNSSSASSSSPSQSSSSSFTSSSSFGSSINYHPHAPLLSCASELSIEQWEEYVHLCWSAPLVACGQSAILLKSGDKKSPHDDEEKKKLIEEFLFAWSPLYRLSEEMHSLQFISSNHHSTRTTTSAKQFIDRRRQPQQQQQQQQQHSHLSTANHGPLATCEELWFALPPRAPSLVHILFCQNFNKKNENNNYNFDNFQEEIRQCDNSLTYELCLHHLQRYAKQCYEILQSFPNNDQTQLLTQWVDLLANNCTTDHNGG